jgi:putative transposase
MENRLFSPDFSKTVGSKDHLIELTKLKEYSRKYSVAIHAWVLMTIHIHLLCTPLEDRAVSQMMQSIGRALCRIL